MTRPIYLRLADLTVPPEARTCNLGRHLAQALPNDASITIIGMGASRAESLEQLVVEIDRATAKLYEARRLALEIIQEETGP
jgi:hypothetical protein